MKRIPTLDGWRGIAIAMVLLDHMQYLLFGKADPRWPQIGQHGVVVFFVLSGFLITSLLLKSTSLKQFYLRRFFRLMPAAWFFLSALSLYILFTGVKAATQYEILTCFFCFRDFANLHGHGPATGYFWSLSLEEQFYLFWPPLLLALDARRARWIIPPLALIFAVVKADWPLSGCLLALLTHEKASLVVIKKVAPWLALPAFAFILLCILRLGVPVLAEPVAIAILIAASMNFPQSVWFRWLDWEPLTFLGRISYSVYVWQVFFFLPTLHIPNIFVFCLPLFALGSYFLIEKPCIHLGHRLSPQLQMEPRASSFKGREPNPCKSI